MGNFWLGIVTGVVSSIIVIVGKIICTNVTCYTQSKYSGKWKDEIYDSNGNIVKRDIYVLKHHKRNNTITGTISRVAPVEQIHRRWKCSGVLSGEHLILLFWSEDVIKSDGCIYAVLKEDFIYYEIIFIKYMVLLQKWRMIDFLEKCHATMAITKV